ncbi:LysM peptidoglycan-binding domain-containing protein [Kineococcus rhizosphaerae]|uniref:LysM peptidoglycan-binding domain-containing protein n=1 Tax=Kineococcus rhizosphaerae TaxID=559628 RepID=UPI001472A738|nr:LysM peptidoglycan-binding domain-containing protein [Kineococcus rhizosphaerae]
MAAVVLIALTTAGVVGIPLVLARLVGNPFKQLSAAGSVMDLAFGAVTPEVVIALIALVVWVAWAVFTLSLLLELVQALPGVRLPAIPGLGWSRKSAGGLLTLITVLLAGPIGAASAAQMPAAPVVAAASAATSTTTSTTTPATTSVAPASTTSPSSTAARTVTVAPGDTLWDLAHEHLGDGTRYGELLQLNEGRPQSDGGHLEAHGYLTPGWVLTLPADAGTPPAASTGGDYVVQRGDSLSKIAERTLHDGDRWPEIAQASADRVQPGGQHLQDPDVIAPGWTLTIPGSTAAAPAPAASPSSTTAPSTTNTESVAPTATASNPTTTSGTSPASPRPEPTSAPAADTSAPDAAQDATTSTAIGVGALLAAGVLTVIAVRRRQQRRARPAGRRLPARASAGTSWAVRGRGAARRASDLDELAVDRLQEDLEAAAAEIEDEGLLLDNYTAASQEQQTSTTAFAQDADLQAVLHLDVMLRLLAVDAHQQQIPMPPVRAARLDANGIELYLAHPAVLPLPWQSLPDDDSDEGEPISSLDGEGLGRAAGTTWLVTTTEAAELVLALVDAETEAAGGDPSLTDTAYSDLYAQPLPLRSVEAPYPTLTTIGTDPDGAIVMLNLEELSSLAITGPTAMAHQVLRAIAIELATSSWADNLHVTLVGDLAPELPAVLGTERLAHVEDVEHLLRALEQSADDVSTLMKTHQVPDLATARAHGLDTDAWTPQLILLGQPLDSDQHRRLQAVVHHLPRVGLAAITTHGEPLGEWVLGLHARTQDAELLPGPVPLHPTRLDDASYTEILTELQAASSREWTSGPSWALGLLSDAQDEAQDEAHEEAHEEAPVTAPAAASDHSAPTFHPELGEDTDAADQPSADHDTIADAQTDLASEAARTGNPLDGAADPAPEPTIDLREAPRAEDVPHSETRAEHLSARPGGASGPHLASPASAAATSPRAAGVCDVEPTSTTWTTKTAEQILTEHTSGPVLAFMGPPVLLGARGEEPTGGDASKKTVLVAQMLYLALMPHPSRASFTTTFWDLPVMDRGAGKNCAGSLSRMRRWLGVDEDGQPYVPRNQQIKLQGVATDHDVFLKLVGCDVASAPLPDLIEALQLVRGLPFEGGRSHDIKHKRNADASGAGAKVQVLKAHYGPWTEDLRQEVRMQIVDVAVHVASVALHREDFTTARRASAVGLRAEPHHTLLIETALRAAAAVGDEEEVNRMIIDHHLQLKADDLEPASSTLRLEADLLAALETR